MVSAIDETKPADGVLALKSDFRANWAAAKNEILELQAEAERIRSALDLGINDSAFDAIGGDNTPSGASTFDGIILALDAAITAAASSGGSGGPITLSDITDILSPTSAIRAAFANPLSGTTQDADFTFDLGSQGSRLITIDNSLIPITMTLEATSVLSARDDGWLCDVVPSSGANFFAITGPTDSLRFQQNRDGALATQTTVFAGLSRAQGIRALMSVYKDGPIYTLVGPGRTTETDNLAIGAAGSVNGSVLAALSLAASAFPNLLDLGGSKQAGGSRSIVRDVGGNTTLTQADAGKIVRLTGGSAATWGVGDLLEGTVIELKSKGGAGVITINPTGALAVNGGTSLASGGAGAIRFFSDEIEIVGTT